jgi:hypothetical protein
MRFRFMGLPIRRLPYLFAKSYNGEPTSDPARPAADPDQNRVRSRRGRIDDAQSKPKRLRNTLSCRANAGHPVITDVSDYWIADGACHRAGQRPDPLAGDDG